jgi:Flp pilus assembly protein TadB
MALNGERTAAIRDDVRNMRESVSRDNLEQKLEEVVEEKPATRSFLEPRPILMAVAIAAVLTLIVALLLSVQLAALVLVLSFGISWVALSQRDYGQRRPTKDANADEESEAAA